LIKTIARAAGFAEAPVLLASSQKRAGDQEMSVREGVTAGRTVEGLSGQSIIQQIKAARIDFVVSVPDITTSEGLLRPLAKETNPRLIRICKEDEGIGICAGLSYTGKRGLLLIQQTGLLDSINAVRGVAVEYNLPICMMVGLLEKEVGVLPRQSKRYGVRIIEPILDAMGIAYHEIEHQPDVAKIRPAIEECFDKSKPVVILIGQRPQ
jgi:sulfopyruvate decarboxylase TPP-binding subunit